MLIKPKITNNFFKYLIFDRTNLNTEYSKEIVKNKHNLGYT